MGRTALLVSLLVLAAAAQSLAGQTLTLPSFQNPGDPGFVYGGSSSGPGGRQWRARHHHPDVSIELGVVAGFFDGDFRSAGGPGSNTISWSGDGLDEDPAVFGLDFRMAIRLTREARWNIWYKATLFRGFSSTLAQPVQSGLSTIPAGSDLNFMAQIHRVGTDWEHFWTRFPGFAGGDGGISTRLGIGWDVPSLSIDSDAFQVAQSKHVLRESLPYPFAGITFEHRWKWDVMRIEATGGWLPEVSTMQKVRGETVKQELMAIDLAASYDWGLADWFSIGGQAGYTSYSFKQSSTTVDREISYDGPWLALRLAMRF